MKDIDLAILLNSMPKPKKITSMKELHKELTEGLIVIEFNKVQYLDVPPPTFNEFEQRKKEALIKYRNDWKFHAEIQVLANFIVKTFERYEVPPHSECVNESYQLKS